MLQDQIENLLTKIFSEDEARSQKLFPDITSKKSSAEQIKPANELVA